jgi:hypothetical protein
MNKIESIKIVYEIDECPDTSYLGEYSNTPDKDGYFIDRRERGDMSRNEYRYFNVGCGDPAYIEQDYARMEALNKGVWYFIGIHAEAKVRTSIDTGGGMQRQTMKSGGLWGIESDFDKDYIQEVAQDECLNLRTQLVSFNVDLTNFQEMAEKAVDEMKV